MVSDEVGAKRNKLIAYGYAMMDRLLPVCDWHFTGVLLLRWCSSSPPDTDTSLQHLLYFLLLQQHTLLALNTPHLPTPSSRNHTRLVSSNTSSVFTHTVVHTHTHTHSIHRHNSAQSFTHEHTHKHTSFKALTTLYLSKTKLFSWSNQLVFDSWDN